MPRNSDKERFFNAIPEDGSPIGNLTLRKRLRLSEDRYWEVRQELLKENKISLSRGQGGSVFRINAEDIREASRPQPRSRYKSERSLYEPFLATIRDKYTKDENILSFVIQKTAHAGKRKTGGTWTRPDVTLVTVQSYPYYPTKSMEIITFEIKHFNDFDITAVFETAAHTRFANRSYLCVYLPENAKNAITDADMERIMTECDRFYTGLVLFEDPTNYDTFDFEIEPPRGMPDPAAQNEFISKQINQELQRKLLALF